MPLASGQRLGPYEVVARLGAGGMGEVYRARDTRLDRIVALKVIQSSAAASQDMRERFEREARAISALDHPHICALYDVVRETVDGDTVSILVMQYLEGETLAETMSRGPIPFNSAIAWAAEIAHALDAAHRRGIVHRDLKPGNVMITKAGTKLLDFGLAKLATGNAGAPAGEETRTSPLGGRGGPLTSPGLILGTLHYMSPEQLEGRDVDTRSDVFSFGALLFETLTGRRAFQAQSNAAVIAAILGEAPALGTLADARVTLPGGARRALDRLLAKCLARNPENRWQSAADLAAELEWINEERTRSVPDSAAPIPVRASRTRERVAYAIAALALAVLGLGSYRWYSTPPPLPQPVSFAIDRPEGFTGGPVSLGLSPDGRQVLLMGGPAGSRQLWVRDLGSLELKTIHRGGDVWNAVVSPDSKFIVYVGAESASNRELWKLDWAGGAPRLLAKNSDFYRAAVNQAGDILYSGDRQLFWIKHGEQPTTVMEADASRGERFLRWPMFLPDGRRYIFNAGNPTHAALYLADLDAPGRKALVVDDVFSNVDYAHGHLFYQRAGTLTALPFDAAAGRPTGPEVPTENVAFNPETGRSAFAVSETGTLVYLSDRGLASSNSLVLFDRDGKKLSQIGDLGPYGNVALSHDARQAAFTHRDAFGRQTIRIMDVERGQDAPFTVGDADERYPVWSPSGDFIAFQRRERNRGARGIYLRGARGVATTAKLLVDNGGPTGFSSDGTLLLMERQGRIWVVTLPGGKATQVFPDAIQPEGAAQFSRDGKWIAYHAGGAADTNVYARPYPADDRGIKISADGGRLPQWADDRHIVYRANDGALMSVELTDEKGTFRPSTPRQLFYQAPENTQAYFYSMDPRTQQFLLVVPPVTDRPNPIMVILNFAQSIGKK